MSAAKSGSALQHGAVSSEFAKTRWRSRSTKPASFRRYAFVALSCGGAKLPAFGLEHVVEAPLGQLDAGGEPEIPRFLHMLDDAAQGERAAGAADDVGMHRERDVFGPIGRFRVKLVEIGLPRLEPVIRVTVFAMPMAEQRAVAERLARKLYQ